jgi:ATP-dependent Clp protease protease subunit
MPNVKRGSVVNIASDTANIFIFGEISEWWGFSKDEVLPILRSNRYNNINLYISSPGGDLGEAFVIHDMLMGNRAVVNAYLLGQCASAATVIASAANTVTISRQCIYMIHKASFGWLSGVNSDDLQRFADILDIYDSSLATIYARKTGMSEQEIINMMSVETWMDAPTATELGFADVLVDSIEVDWAADNYGSVDDEDYDDDEVHGIRNPRKKMKYVYDQDSVYKGAVLNLITKGIPANKVPASASKKITMNSFFKSIVNALTSAGLIASDKSGEATAALEQLDVIASVREALPSVTKPQVIEALRSLTADERNELFGVPVTAVVSSESEDNAAELRSQIEQLQAQLADVSKVVASNAGKMNVPAAGNGAVPAPAADATGAKKISAAQRQMIEEGYRNGLMPKSVYESLLN